MSVDTSVMPIRRKKELYTKLLRAKLDRSFYDFFIHFWPIFSANVPLVIAPHLKVVCDELQHVGERIIVQEPKAYDLIINIPPGMSKTSMCSIAFPAWLWTRNPSLAILLASYGRELSVGNALRVRDILTSDSYAEIYGRQHLRLRKDNSGKTAFGNTAGGIIVTAGVGGVITGKHFDIKIVDDPIKAQDANSQKARDNAIDWNDNTLSLRNRDHKITVQVTIMQRLHMQDSTGHLLEKAQTPGSSAVRHVCLPAQLSEHVRPLELAAIYENGLLDPKRLSAEVLAEKQIEMGSVGFAGQMGQSPVAPGGNIIKADWLELNIVGWAPPPTDDDLMNASHYPTFWVDTAYTEDEANDPTGIIATVYVGYCLYILEAVSVHLEFPELIAYLKNFCIKHGYDGLGSRIWVENKASGKSLVQTLKRTTDLNVRESKNPGKDKVQRVNAAAPFIECGRLKLVRGPWNEGYIQQCTAFPNAPHDDEIDVTATACSYYLARGGRPEPELEPNE